MIATTTSNSMSVNPTRFIGDTTCHLAALL